MNEQPTRCAKVKSWVDVTRLSDVSEQLFWIDSFRSIRCGWEQFELDLALDRAKGPFGLATAEQER